MAGSTEVDLVESVAFPLPVAVICELLGVPNDDAEELRRWSTILVTGSLAPPAEWAAAATALVGYARSLLAVKRRTPADDLLSARVAARDGADQLTEDELTSMVFLLLLAGQETTVNLIANSVATLLDHPTRLALVRADPTWLPVVVEEVLRYEGPVQVATPRFAAVFDPFRAEAAPHLAFGHGIHHCFGAPLARLETRIALGGLLDRFPRLSLAVAPGELTWRPSFLMHGLTRLPVALD